MKIKSLKTLAALTVIALAFGGCEQPADGDSAAGLNSLYGDYGFSFILGVEVPGTWTRSNDPPFMYTDEGTLSTINGVAGTNGTLVAVAGTTGEAYAATSTDGGATWTTDPDSLPGLGRAPSVVHYLNGFYLATPGNNGITGAYSADGVNWDKTGDIGFGCKTGVYGTKENFYVVAGQHGQAAYTDSLVADFNYIPQTTTGWVGSGSAYYINAGAYGATTPYPTGVFVFGGGSGRLVYTETILDPVTEDLNDWEPAVSDPFGDSEFINVIAYGNGIFVAVGGKDGGAGRAAYSTNGVDWYEAANFPLGNTASVYALAYGDGYFVAGDDDGYIAYSNDGDIWSRMIEVFEDGSGINAIGFDGGTFAAVGGGAGLPRVAFSIP
jgi:hypothetical protein